MMGRSPHCYIPSFEEIRPLVLEKKNFEGILPYTGKAAILVMFISSNFHFLVPESVHTNLVQNGTVDSEKILFEFLYVHNLGPRSRNDLDLNTHISS